MNDVIAKNNPRSIALWLFGCAALVFVMVIVGAITRLTESGLSMVEWRPLIGALPPMNDLEWDRVFYLYQQTPEFKEKNFWMEIEDFKMIFFWEWFHRFLGRLIGLAYGLPLIWFWVRGIIPKGYKLKLFGLLILGGLQGLMGWYMVQSGLVDQPNVSHYRLAAHLGLAFLIFSLLLWVGLSLTNATKRPNKALFTHACSALGTLVLTIFWGAYTAGMDAGLIYNETFPKMAGQWLPKELLSPQPHQPVWINFFETHMGVQFTHRWLAMGSVLVILSFWAHARMKKQSFLTLHLIAAMAVIQMSLGIATLLSQVALPLATLHQAGALILLGLLVKALHRLKP